MKEKLKPLLLPYLIIALGFIIIYCFTCWTLFIKFKVADADEDIINFWLPFFLPFIPIFIWLKPKIKLLQLKRTGSRSPDFGYIMIATLAIAAPTIVAMNYIESASGKLTQLNDITDIKKFAATKFYTVKNFYVDKNNVGVYYSSSVSGRYNSELNLHIYVSCPIYNKTDRNRNEIIRIDSLANNDSSTNTDNSTINTPNNKPLIIVDGRKISMQQLSHIPPDSVQNITALKGNAAKALYGSDARNGVLLIKLKKEKNIIDEEIKPDTPAAWLGIKYSKEISNYLNNERKKELEHEFYNETQSQFENSSLGTFTYFNRMGNSDDRKSFRMAAAKTSLIEQNNQAIIFEPKYGGFNSRTGYEFLWIFGAFAIGLSVWFIMILIPKINKEQLNNPEENKTSILSIEKYFKFLLPRQDYYVTPIIIDLNIFVFLLMMISGLGFLSFNTIDLLKWGANYSSYTTNNQLWRLLSNIFVHAGFIHLFSNMFALFFIGLILEPIIGKKTFAISYIVSGIVASIASIYLHDNVVSVGASGAIFGLYGIFLALLLTKSVSKDLSKEFFTSTLIFIGYNLAMGFANSVIDNAAHIGGLITGLLIGFYLSTVLKREDKQSF